MRAAVIRGYRTEPSIETVADTVCEPDGVLRKVLACGICRSDWHGWVGEPPKVEPGAFDAPMLPGAAISDFAG